METWENSIKTDIYGRPILNSEQLVHLLLQGNNINRLTVSPDEDIELFKKYQYELLENTIVFENIPDESLSFDEFHEQCSNTWIFPERYQQIDVLAWLHDKCNTQQQHDRVDQEYTRYQERDLVMLLRLFIYLVDYMRENRFLWGVGRGSSVSSYILYLIGIHRVDSIKYQLDINDYLK